jgi:hypothetical protein
MAIAFGDVGANYGDGAPNSLAPLFTLANAQSRRKPEAVGFSPLRFAALLRKASSHRFAFIAPIPHLRIALHRSTSVLMQPMRQIVRKPP